MGIGGDPIEEYGPVIYFIIGLTFAIALLHLFLDADGITTSEESILWIVSVLGLLLYFFLGWLYNRIHNNRVAKVIQCLPLTVDDWKKYDVHTNEEAVQTLRELVHGFGYSWRILHDREVIRKIETSYSAYLDFVYGEDEDAKAWNKITDNNPGYHDVILITCPDKEFDHKLKLALERREEVRQNWCKQGHDASILENLKATEDRSL